MDDIKPYSIPIPDKEIDAFASELKSDGIVMSREEARDAILNLVELYALISLPPPDEEPESTRRLRD